MNWTDLKEKLKNQGKAIETALDAIRQETPDVSMGRRGDILRRLRQQKEEIIGKIQEITKEKEVA